MLGDMSKRTTNSSYDYSGVRRSLTQATTLPSWCYTSEQIYDQEIEQIFLRQWQFAGREEEIAESGQYFCHDGVGGSVIVIRGAKGEINAFANTCRHRGSRLVSGDGQCARIVCPYHSWVYGLDGQLVGAPGMQEVENFSVADFPLLKIPVDAWGGFIFVNYDESCIPLEQHLGNMPEKFDAHGPASMKLVHSVVFEINCNWKLLAENALEAYHTGTVHRDTLGQQKSRAVESTGNWTGLLVEDETSVATMTGDDKPFPHIQGLGNEAKSGTYFSLLFPCTEFVFAQDCMWWLDFRPVAVDKTVLKLGACFPESTIALSWFEEKVELYKQRWKLATEEDNRICETQQQGQVFDRPPGRFSNHEFAVHAFENWVLDQTCPRV